MISMKFVRNTVVVFFIAVLIALTFTSVSGQSNFTCLVCEKKITGKHLVIDEDRIHNHCFVCAECGKPIKGSINKEVNDLYHPACFRKHMGYVCTHCGKVLDDKWVEKDEKKYHAPCLEEVLRIYCDICKKPVEGEFVKDEQGRYHYDCFRDHWIHCLLPRTGDLLLPEYSIWSNHHIYTCSPLPGSKTLESYYIWSQKKPEMI